MSSLENKIVLITGAGKGSGHILARVFAEQGAVVAANDISPINLDNLVANGNGRIKAYVEDVAKKVGAQSIVKQVEDDFGKIDILINHASVEPHVPLLDMDEWDWHRVLDVNLTGAFLMMQSVGRVMRAQGSGVIINLITAKQDLADREAEAAFVASMQGLEALTREAGRELNPYGIQVYAIESGADKIVEKVFSLLDNLLEEAMKELTEYRAQLINRLTAVAKEFRTACLALKDPYAPLEENGWSVHQVAVHTRDVDKFVYGLRARRTAVEDNPEFQNFDGDAYMAASYNVKESMDTLLNDFVDSIETLAQMLRALPVEAWSRQSRHATLGGGFTLQTWVERNLAHIEEHVKTVKTGS